GENVEERDPVEVPGRAPATSEQSAHAGASTLEPREDRGHERGPASPDRQQRHCPAARLAAAPHGEDPGRLAKRRERQRRAEKKDDGRARGHGWPDTHRGFWFPRLIAFLGRASVRCAEAP